MDAGQAKPTRAHPVGIPQNYDLASHVALPAQTKQAEQKALVYGLLDYISHCKLISHIRLLLVVVVFECSNPSPCFTEKETEAQRILATFLRPHSLVVTGWDSARSPDYLSAPEKGFIRPIP